MVTKLDEYEVKVLRICAGQAVPGMHWGGAMGQALECLVGSGMIVSKAGKYEATQDGEKYLAGLHTTETQG